MADSEATADNRPIPVSADLTTHPPPAGGGQASDTRPQQPPVEATGKRVPGSGARGGSEVSTGDIAAGRDVIAIASQNITTIHALSERPKLRSFLRYDMHRVASAAQDLICDPQSSNAVISILRQRRLLVVVGEPQSGKVTTLLHAAGHMIASDDMQSVLVSHQFLGRDLQIPIDEITGENEKYRGCMVILKDAFAQENVDLLRFANSLNDLQLNALTERLSQHRSFLVLTSDSSAVRDGLEERLQSLNALFVLPPLSFHLLRALLLRLADRLLEASGITNDIRTEVGSLLEDEENVRKILAATKTPPRLDRFVRDSLAKVATGTCSLDQALENLDDPTFWLLHELPEDFEAWCYALSLILSHAAPAQVIVPWLQFDKFRQEVVRVFGKATSFAFLKGRTAHDVCREELLCSKARATVQPLGFPFGSGIHFETSIDVARLWSVMLGPGRNLLGLILPHLREMTLSSEPDLRQMAARALGRIGELSPQSTAFPFMASKLSEGKNGAEIFGHFLAGVLGSQDLDYREWCLWLVRQASLSEDLNVAEAAVLGLREVGGLDLDLALSMLRQVAEKRLAPLLEVSAASKRVDGARTHLNTLVDEQHDWSSKTSPASPLSLRLIPYLFLELEIDGITRRNFDLFQAMSGILVDLCFKHGPVRVLVDITHWTSETKCEMQSLLALLFLGYHQVADTLEAARVPISRLSSREGAEGYPFILHWLSPPETEKDIDGIVDFLAAVHIGSSGLPSLWRKDLHARWRGLLTGWLRVAAEITECRKAVAGIVQRLQRKDDPDIKEDISKVLSDFGGSTGAVVPVKITPAAPMPAPPSPG